MSCARFLYLLIAVAVSCGTVAAQTCPGDATRTGVFTGQGITPPGLKCEGSGAQGRTCSGFLPSAVDGTLLEVTVSVPPGAGPHPLVVVLHGWGGGTDSLGYLAGPLLADGHAVLRYAARGFGNSWGQVNLADIDVELADLRSMIGQVVDQGPLHIDGTAVGVVGVSYGGGQAWLAWLRPSFSTPRGRPVQIRTVVPIVPWTDLLYSLNPNGRPTNSIEPPGAPKLSYLNALYAGGLRFSQERPYPNYPEYLTAWHAWINAMEPNRVDPIYQQIERGLTACRSVWWQQALWPVDGRPAVPVFQLQGFTDDLFPLPEAKRMLDALKARDPLYPIASYFGDIGHPRARNKPKERDFVVGLVQKWFAFYLRGEGLQPEHGVQAAITRPGTDFDPERDLVSVPGYEALSNSQVSKEFAAAARLVNPPGDPAGGFAWDPLVMTAAQELEPLPPAPASPAVPGSRAVYTVAVNELAGGGEPLLIAGQPSVSLRAQITSGVRVQLDVRLFDVATGGERNLITRGTLTLEGFPGSADVVIPTYGNLWEAPSGHALELEITNVDSPYLAPSRVPSATVISQVRLTIPRLLR